MPAHIRNSLDELRAFADAGGQTKRFPSPPPPTPREPTFVSFAPLNCKTVCGCQADRSIMHFTDT